MNTKKTRREQTKKEEKEVCGGSDIFTQLPHTNRTTELYTHTKNKSLPVKRANWKKKERDVVDFLYIFLTHKYDDSWW